MTDARAELADLIAGYLNRQRTVPLHSVSNAVIPDGSPAPTVLLTVTTKDGQKIAAEFRDDPDGEGRNR